MRRLLPRVSPADRRLLPEGRLAGPVPWVIAIMMFLMVLAAAGGLALGNAAGDLSSDLEGRATVQIVEANPDVRARQTEVALATLRRLPAVRRAEPVREAEMRRLIEPWLGSAGLEEELPLPAMIDIQLDPGVRDAAAVVRRALLAEVPTSRVDEHARALAPLGGLIADLKWLALALVVLMAMATTAAVVLAARAAINTHRATIDVMHLLGATDAQIAGLFQRRIALDALLGGFVGLALGAIVILLLGIRIGTLGSELVGSVALPWQSWLVLAALPFAGTALAMLTVRQTVLGALERIL